DTSMSATKAALTDVDFWCTMGQAHYPNSKFRGIMDISYAPLNAQGQSDPHGTVNRYTNLQLPCFNVSGWWDIFTEGQIQTWQNLMRYSNPGIKNYQKLVIGPWAHQTTGTRATGDMIQEPNGMDYRYKENVSQVLGADLDNIDAS